MQSMPNLLQALALADQQGINLRPFVRYMLSTAAPDVRDVESLIPDTPAPGGGPQALGGSPDPLGALMGAGQGAGQPALGPGPEGALPPGDNLDLQDLLQSMSPEELTALLGTSQ
jgi:hypothetical protein